MDNYTLMSELEDEIVPEEEGEGGQPALKRLREKLATCVAEKQEYLDGWQRMRADFANTKREEEKRRHELVTAARLGIVAEMIPALDSFDMALRSEGETASEHWRNGFENIKNQLLSVLKRQGVVPFQPLNEPFNPAEHESVSTAPVQEEKEDQKIIEVLQAGYKAGETIVRPAKVIVGNYKV